jgi:hypothetical protein
MERKHRRESVIVLRSNFAVNRNCRPAVSTRDRGLLRGSCVNGLKLGSLCLPNEASGLSPASRSGCSTSRNYRVADLRDLVSEGGNRELRGCNRLRVAAPFVEREIQ